MRGGTRSPSRARWSSCSSARRAPKAADTSLSLADQLRVAVSTRDLEAFGALLSDDVRWGDDDHPRKCRGRNDVLNTFASLMAEGVEGDVTEMTVGSSGIACRLHVRWPDPADKGRGVDFFHVYIVRDGRVSEIRRYDDRASALAAVNAQSSD